MDCARRWDHLSAYLDGDLPEIEREGIERHLRQCARCAEEERALKETLSLLRDLPAEKAPPELFEGISRRIANDPVPSSLWKTLFLPARVKIPLEAAAVVLIFLLAYGIQKEMPSPKPPPPSPAAVGNGRMEAGTGMRQARPAAVVPAGRSAEGVGRERGRKTARPPTAAAMREEMRPAGDSGPPSELPAVRAEADLPSVPATRVSTGRSAIGSPYPETTPVAESFGPRPFFAAESRPGPPLPHEREVTIEVSPGERAGLPDRIADVVLHLGGTFHREITMTARGPGAGEAPPLREVIRVLLPFDRAGVFLEELGKLGSIPPEERAVPVDFPAGEAPETVAYSVRVRIR